MISTTEATSFWNMSLPPGKQQRIRHQESPSNSLDEKPSCQLRYAIDPLLICKMSIGFPTAGSRCLVPGLWSLVPCTRCLVGPWYQVLGTRCLALGARHWCLVLGSWYVAPTTWYVVPAAHQFPGTLQQVPGTRYQISGTRFQVQVIVTGTRHLSPTAFTAAKTRLSHTPRITLQDPQSLTLLCLLHIRH